MVLGLRSRHRKAASVQVDYLVHVGEIKPWPPSQSLRSVRYVLLQWENGDQNSGSLTCGVGDIKIGFNESITLPITLNREKKAHDKFQKNLLEFNLYEPRTDKSTKSQLLGTATINLAEYGIIEENLLISVPLNLKRSSKNTVQPILFLKIQPKEVSLDKDVQNYSSELMNDENDDESEIASFTDDDVSSHSSRTVTSSSALEASGASPYRNEKDGFERAMENNHAYVPKSPEIKTSTTEPAQPISSFICHSNTIEEESINHEQKSTREDVHEDIGQIEEHAHISDKLAEQVPSSNTYNQVDVNSKPNRDDQWKKIVQVRAIPMNDLYVDEEKSQEEIERDERILEEMRASVNKQTSKFSQSGIKKQGALRSNTLTTDRRAVGATTSNNNKLKHMKSVQLPPHSTKTNGFPQNIQKIDNIVASNVVTEIKKVENNSCDDRVEMLEEELKEAAAIEVGLYSIVAEHGSSINKVHAPARRLSRFYLHACKATMSKDKRASAARAIISGLVLVSKACGNDVPRLTFWLSNSIMLRAIVSQSIEELQLSDGEEAADCIEECDDWQDPKTFMVALEKIEGWIFSRIVESVWWQTLTPHMQSTAAAAASSSRSTISSSRKNSGKRYGLGDQEQDNFSIQLWKKAFKDACERLCPIRGGGHVCGCLPVARLVMGQLVSRLDVAMFNAVLRESDEEMPTDPVSDPIGDLKVLPIPAGRTSFGAGAQLKNAIGNWSRWLTDLFGIEDNDFPDENNNRPEFDTSFKSFRLLNALSDLMMLPSEMLADVSTRKEFCPLFGTPLIKRVVCNFVPDEFCPHPIPDTVLQALDSEDDDDVAEVSEGDSLTSFPCIAKATVYKPPPAASLAGIIGQVGSGSLERSKSSVLKKAYTSDDELDELDSPLTSIFNDNFLTDNWIPKGKGGRKVVRYQLLRQVWRDGEY